MILKRGNLWDSKADLILVTANSTVRTDGALVMGRGAALEAKTKFTGCNFMFGDLVEAWKRVNTLPYGVIVHPTMCDPGLGIFQVKRFFRSPADFNLIRNSVGCLVGISRKYKLIALNFPGIGNGQLTREDVLPLIEGLPDNVEVWEYD